MKIAPEIVNEVAKRHLDPEQARKLTEEAEKLAKEISDEEKAMKPPPQKKQFVVLLWGDEELIDCDNLTASICQIPEDDDTAATVGRIDSACYEYNISKKGRRYPVKTRGEGLEAVPARMLKEQKVWVKTKIPVRVIVPENELPEI